MSAVSTTATHSSDNVYTVFEEVSHLASFVHFSGKLQTSHAWPDMMNLTTCNWKQMYSIRFVCLRRIAFGVAVAIPLA
jgi:hypothetical protein